MSVQDEDSRRFRRLEDEVRRAVGRDRLRVHFTLERLKDALRTYHQSASETASARASERDVALRHFDVADEIRRHAHRLDNVLRKHQSRVAEAVALGFLLPNRRQRRDPRMGDLAGWPPKHRVQELLAELIDDANKWAERAQAAGRRRRGRFVGGRIHLAEYVALTLAKAGVRLQKSRTGHFARVLEAVYDAADLRTRDIFRDIRKVLENSDLAPYFESVRRKVQKPRARKSK